MNVKDLLCTSFCTGLEVNPVKIGLAIGTPFEKGDGDRIGFFVRTDMQGRYRIEDDGLSVATLLASGVDVETGQRAELFRRLMQEAGASLDAEGMVLHTPWLDAASLGNAAIRFVALLMRIPDLQMLHPDKIAGTFREDVLAALADSFRGIAIMERDVPVAPELGDFHADAVLIAGEFRLAVFVATSDTRIYEAVLARALSSAPRRRTMKVAAVLDSERTRTISIKAQQRARNYLDAAPSFMGDTVGTMSRLRDLLHLDGPPGAVH